MIEIESPLSNYSKHIDYSDGQMVLINVTTKTVTRKGFQLKLIPGHVKNVPKRYSGTDV